MIALTGSRSRIVGTCPSRSTIRNSDAPTSRLPRDKLKWEPKVPLEQGLKKTIEYFDGQLRSNRAVSRVGR